MRQKQAILRQIDGDLVWLESRYKSIDLPGWADALVYDSGGEGEALIFAPVLPPFDVIHVPQIKHFAGKYRVVAYRCRESLERPIYPAERAEEIKHLMDHLGIESAHFCGLNEDATASALPRLAIPVGLYLDDRRVFGEEGTREQVYCDPLALKSYSLYFLSSLFCADMSFLTSGEIGCSVIIAASTGDKLFPFGYVKWIYERIVAPDKEMLVFDLDRHLIFNECVEEVLPSVAEKLEEYSTRYEE
jgi:hypothetical protein